MHSGYPIVTSLDVSDPKNDNFIFNLPSLQKNGQWGVFHEIGHNMQRDWWTYEGTGEVTVNIFSLKATEIVVGTTPKDSKWLNDQKQKIREYLKKPDFIKWKADPGIALGIYAQIIEEFGWDTIKKVFSSYEGSPKELLPKNNQ
jgi:hypothetical protein